MDNCFGRTRIERIIESFYLQQKSSHFQRANWTNSGGEFQSVFIWRVSLSFDEMIALINEIKGIFDEEEDAEQFATRVTARFLQQAKY